MDFLENDVASQLDETWCVPTEKHQGWLLSCKRVLKCSIDKSRFIQHCFNIGSKQKIDLFCRGSSSTLQKTHKHI